MLLVAAPLPRLDRVQFVERLEPSAHEAYAAHFEAAGQGLVAMRVARALGLEALLLGFRGQTTGDLLAQSFVEERLDVEWVEMAAATAMGTVMCGCDRVGASTRRTCREPAPRVQDRELRSYVEAFDRQLAAGPEAVLFVEPERNGALGIVMTELMRRVRVRDVPVVVVTSELCAEVLACEPTILLEDALPHSRRRASPAAERVLGAGASAWLWRESAPTHAFDETPTHRLELGDLSLQLDVPEAPDRGGDAPFEAAAVAWLVKRREGWPMRMSACWAMGAAAAQRLKELGGRLSLAEIDGFFAQVRARELDLSE